MFKCDPIEYFLDGLDRVIENRFSYGAVLEIGVNLSVISKANLDRSFRTISTSAVEISAGLFSEQLWK